MMAFFIILFGLATGSFLNVCIHRLPRDESLGHPGSSCPACGARIGWQDNIPVISYLCLRGQCRHCRAKISPRYVLVEILNAFCWYLLWKHSGWGLTFVFSALLFSILLTVVLIDFETGLIPDELTLTGLAAGLVWSGLAPGRFDAASWHAGLLMAFLGGLLGGGLLFLTGYLGRLLFRKDSMGGGDVKLLAMLGTFLGMQKVVWIFLLAPVLALPAALIAKLVFKEETIPFGPYLAAAGAILFLWGDWLIRVF